MKKKKSEKYASSIIHSKLFEMNSYSGKDLGSFTFIDNMIKQSFPKKHKPKKY